MSILNSAKRACDACHRRKVKCNSQQPCGNCSQAHLACTYDAIPQKKGPKGSRAKVISELRETQRLPNIAVHQPTQNGHRIHTSPDGSPTQSPAPNLLPLEMIDNCVTFFFTHMYPTMPILRRDQVQQVIGEMSTNMEAYCLITSLCAFMLIQPGIAASVGLVMDEPAGSITNPRMGSTLVEEAVRVRKRLEYIENPTVDSVVTSFFLFGCCFGLSRHNTAWNHLREATSQVYSLGMQNEESYQYGILPEISRKRRIFWLLFVSERAYALQKHVPLTLHATIGLPTIDSESPNSIAGFIHLVNLYRPFDDTFIGLWNKSRSDCSTYWLAQLQQQLTKALPDYLDTTESQAADLRTSQQWLRTVVWQLSITNGYLSSSSPDISMTFGFPIEVARDLVSVCRTFSKQSMEIHGIGLIEKVFDVACTLIDVMSCVPVDSPDPQTYLNELLNLIADLRGGETRYLPLVMTKIKDTLPSIGPALPQHLVRKAAAAAQQQKQQSYQKSSSMMMNTITSSTAATSATTSSASSPASSVLGGSTGTSTTAMTTPMTTVAAVSMPISSAAASAGMDVLAGARIKQEHGMANGAFSQPSSPYDKPFLQYYPMA